MGTNALIALQVAAQLLQQLEAINALITTSAQTGVDISSDQLDQLVTNYNTAHTQLDADIAAAKAAGK